MRGQLERPVREGGMKKRAGSNPETALHVDPTTTSPWSTIVASWWPNDGLKTTLPGFGHCWRC